MNESIREPKTLEEIKNTPSHQLSDYEQQQKCRLELGLRPLGKKWMRPCMICSTLISTHLTVFKCRDCHSRHHKYRYGEGKI